MCKKAKENFFPQEVLQKKTCDFKELSRFAKK